MRGSGATEAISTAKFIWGPGIDEAVRMKDYSTGRWYYYNLDHLQSVREITDDTGNVVELYDYDAFGLSTHIGHPLAPEVQIIQ